MDVELLVMHLAPDDVADLARADPRGVIDPLMVCGALGLESVITTLAQEHDVEGRDVHWAYRLFRAAEECGSLHQIAPELQTWLTADCWDLELGHGGIYRELIDFAADISLLDDAACLRAARDHALELSARHRLWIAREQMAAEYLLRHGKINWELELRPEIISDPSALLSLLDTFSSDKSVRIISGGIVAMFGTGSELEAILSGATQWQRYNLERWCCSDGPHRGPGYVK